MRKHSLRFSGHFEADVSKLPYKNIEVISSRYYMDSNLFSRFNYLTTKGVLSVMCDEMTDPRSTRITNEEDV